MDSLSSGYEFQNGDHVSIVDDDWSNLGRDLILLDAEPVPGSTQCVVQSGGETLTVSRGLLRRA